MDIKREYRASPTCWAFHESPAFIRGLMGPIGSGKSVACCVELMKLATEQEPSNDGKRYSRWAIIRNTYRELLDTTTKTWFDWFPKELGTWRAGDMEFHMDVGDLNIQFLFRALDRPDDIRKLLSLELTGAWINEAREVPRAVLDMLQGRVGRYPSMRDGKCPTRNCIIMDTNPPDTDHWWYRLFEEEKPDDWELFKQPSGLRRGGENLANLPAQYYTRLKQGHDQAWIDVYCHGQYGFVKDGKPVYPEYQDDVHCLKEHPAIFKPKAGATPLIYVGIDFGLTPAAVMSQQLPDGQYQALTELVTEDMGALKFGELLAQHLRSEYSGCEFEIWGDPAGEQRSQADEKTPFKVLKALGIPARPAPSNDPIIRRESVAKAFTTMTMTGKPRLVISPRCKQLRKAYAGGYKYRRLQVSGDDKYMDKPDKNRYSHVAEAHQYLMVGAGEGRTLIQPSVDVSRFKARPTIGRKRVKSYA